MPRQIQTTLEYHLHRLIKLMTSFTIRLWLVQIHQKLLLYLVFYPKFLL